MKISHCFDCLYLDEAEVFGGQETGEQIPREDWKTKKTEGLLAWPGLAWLDLNAILS